METHAGHGALQAFLLGVTTKIHAHVDVVR